MLEKVYATNTNHFSHTFTTPYTYNNAIFMPIPSKCLKTYGLEGIHHQIHA